MTVDMEAAIWTVVVLVGLYCILTSPLLLVFVWPLGCFIVPVWALWRWWHDDNHPEEVEE